MEKQKNTQLFVIAVLSVVLLTMSVGFAGFAQTLNINGNVTVEGAKWEVGFVTNTYTESTNSVEATNKSVTGTDMTYSVKLAPQEFYEFTVTVKNTGTLKAQLNKITMSSLTADQAKYLTYTVYYNNTAYTATTDSLALDLVKDATATVKVRVEYVLPESASDLPSEDVDVTLTASLDYSQV